VPSCKTYPHDFLLGAASWASGYPPLAFASVLGALQRGVDNPFQGPAFYIKKEKVVNPLKYLMRDDQFLRVFVQILILFAQIPLVKLSKLVHSAVHVRSKQRLQNEQRQSEFQARRR
jgi:hypothetical protein